MKKELITPTTASGKKKIILYRGDFEDSEPFEMICDIIGAPYSADEITIKFKKFDATWR